MKYLLAHDLGTSADKATLFSTEGILVGSITSAYKTEYNKPLWVEQNALDWWNAFIHSTRELMKYYKVDQESIIAVSFSGQMMGCLPVDRDGNPLRKSIIWADQRSQVQSERLRESITDKHFYNLNGHKNTSSYGIQKAMWIMDNEPEVYDRTYKFLNAKDFIVYKLTGKFYTDCSDANSMTCFDQKKRNWSEEIVQASGVDYDKLPEVVESIYCVGNICKGASIESGLSVKTKVVMGAGDGVAANVGAGSVEVGKTYCCLGTSAWVASTSEKPILDEEMRIVCWTHAVPGMYSPNGTMQYAGGSYNWLKNTLCEMEMDKARKENTSPYSIMNQEISLCEPGADGLLFLPYLLGERAPRWNPNAKGVFFGITPNTTKPQIVRSVMEGVIMNLAICFDILRQEVPINETILIGGGARSSEWQQCVADLFDCDVLVPELLEESNSMGAAIIAGIGAGEYKDFSIAEKFIKINEKKMANQEINKKYVSIRKKYELVYQALKGVFD